MTFVKKPKPTQPNTFHSSNHRSDIVKLNKKDDIEKRINEIKQIITEKVRVLPEFLFNKTKLISLLTENTTSKSDMKNKELYLNRKSRKLITKFNIKNNKNSNFFSIDIDPNQSQKKNRNLKETSIKENSFNTVNKVSFSKDLNSIDKTNVLTSNFNEHQVNSIFKDYPFDDFSKEKDFLRKITKNGSSLKENSHMKKYNHVIKAKDGSELHASNHVDISKNEKNRVIIHKSYQSYTNKTLVGLKNDESFEEKSRLNMDSSRLLDRNKSNRILFSIKNSSKYQSKSRINTNDDNKNNDNQNQNQDLEDEDKENDDKNQKETNKIKEIHENLNENKTFSILKTKTRQYKPSQTIEKGKKIILSHIKNLNTNESTISLYQKEMNNKFTLIKDKIKKEYNIDYIENLTDNQYIQNFKRYNNETERQFIIKEHKEYVSDKLPQLCGDDYANNCLSLIDQIKKKKYQNYYRKVEKCLDDIIIKAKLK